MRTSMLSPWHRAQTRSELRTNMLPAWHRGHTKTELRNTGFAGSGKLRHDEVTSLQQCGEWDCLAWGKGDTNENLSASAQLGLLKSFKVMQCIFM